MSPGSNEHNGTGPLRTALIADADRIAALATAAGACPELKLLGQAGMPQAAALPDLPWHDDRRVLVTQPELDVVLLAGTTRTDAKMAAVACAHGLHVWRLPPLARGFAEAAEAIRHARQHERVYRTASWWEYVLDHGWSEFAWPDAFVPRYSEVHVSAVGPAEQTWRARTNEAAGGVLANSAYDALEALVAVRGLPETVSSATATYHEAARETDDTALAILRYADGGTALVRATWDCPPWSYRIAHLAGTSGVTIIDDEVTLTVEGVTTDQRTLPSEWWAADLRRFVEHVRSGARDRAMAPLERHLSVSALIETIYLAAQTLHPETPQKLYEVQGWPLPHA